MTLPLPTTSGYGNSASGYYASAFGVDNTASELKAVAVGIENLATGEGSSVFGVQNVVSGYYSTISGYYNTVSGWSSVAHGFGNVVAGGEFNTASGCYNTVSGEYGCSSIGYKNLAGDPDGTPIATAIGALNIALQPWSSAVGYGNIASSSAWGPQFNIINIEIGDGVTAFTVDGDQSRYFIPYYLMDQGSGPGWALIENNFYGGKSNDGAYQVTSVILDGVTIITVSTELNHQNASGTIRGAVSFQGASSWDIALISQEDAYFAVAGNFLHDFANAVRVWVFATDVGNDGFYDVDHVTYDGTYTYIYILTDNSGNDVSLTSIASPTVAGEIQGNLEILDNNGESIDPTGWGATAFGYRNQANNAQTMAFGHKNIADGYGSSAIGSLNQASAIYSTACGYKNTTSDYGHDGISYEGTGWASSAFGYMNGAWAGGAVALGFQNTASSYYAVSVGAGNITSGGYGSTSCGYFNMTSGASSSTFGHNNTSTSEQSSTLGYSNSTSGSYSNAIGYRNYVNALGATAIGFYGQARCENTVNIGGGIIIRQDNNFAYTYLDGICPLNQNGGTPYTPSGAEVTMYSGVNNVIMTGMIDLTQTGTTTINMPTGSTFYVDECSLLIESDTITPTNQPVINFGDTINSSTSLLDSTTTSGLGAKRSRQTWSLAANNLNNPGGVSSLIAGIATAGNGGTGAFLGRFYFKGILIEDTFPSLLPTIVETTNSTYSQGASITANITSAGSASVTDRGLVWAYGSSTTTPIIGGSGVTQVTNGSGTGIFTTTFDNAYGDGAVYFGAYATNGYGTSYTAYYSFDAEPCFIAGTKITLANGSQEKIENIGYNHNLLVWNFDKGRLDVAAPVWISKSFKKNGYRLAKFSDGSSLGIVPAPQVGHRIFNIDKSKFTYLGTEDTPIGTKTFNDNGKIVSLVSLTNMAEEVTLHNIMTHTHINMFANGVLTSSGLNNVYPVEDMKFVKEKREMRIKEEFGEVSDALFAGLRLAEQPLSYSGLREKVSFIIRKQQI